MIDKLIVRKYALNWMAAFMMLGCALFSASLMWFAAGGLLHALDKASTGDVLLMVLGALGFVIVVIVEFVRMWLAYRWRAEYTRRDRELETAKQERREDPMDRLNYG